MVQFFIQGNCLWDRMNDYEPLRSAPPVPDSPSAQFAGTNYLQTRSCSHWFSHFRVPNSGHRIWEQPKVAMGRGPEVTSSSTGLA